MRISTARDLGALVRQARQDQGLTQSDLAEKVGATRQWVAQLEAGAPNTRLELVLEALRALDLRVDVEPAERPAQALPAPSHVELATLLLSRSVPDAPVPALARHGSRYMDLFRRLVPGPSSSTLTAAGAVSPAVADILAGQARRLATIERAAAASTDNDAAED